MAKRNEEDELVEQLLKSGMTRFEIQQFKEQSRGKYEAHADRLAELIADPKQGVARTMETVDKYGKQSMAVLTAVLGKMSEPKEMKGRKKVIEAIQRISGTNFEMAETILLTLQVVTFTEILEEGLAQSKMYKRSKNG